MGRENELLPAAAHDHRRRGRRIGPAEIGADFDILDLAAAAFAVVVGVLALAVGADRAGIVGVVAQLAGVLDDHVHAVGVALAQMAARGVVGPLAAERDRAVRHVVAALALFAEAVILELQHRRKGEGVVGAGDVDILGPDPGVRPQNLLRVMAGDGRDRPVLVMHVEPRLVAAADDAADQHQRLLHVLGAVGAGDDDAGGVVGLDAAIEEVQRLADKAAVDHVVDREALLVIGLRVVRGVARVEHLHMRDLLRRRAVIVHVAHKGRRKALPGALPAIGAVVQHVAGDRRRRARAGAADADLREAVHRAEDRDRLAAARPR